MFVHRFSNSNWWKPSKWMLPKHKTAHSNKTLYGKPHKWFAFCSWILYTVHAAINDPIILYLYRSLSIFSYWFGRPFQLFMSQKNIYLCMNKLNIFVSSCLMIHLKWLFFKIWMLCWFLLMFFYLIINYLYTWYKYIITLQGYYDKQIFIFMFVLFYL